MLLKNIGTAALSDDDLNALTMTRTDMSGIYNRARICPYNNPGCNLETQGLTLDPDIEGRLATLASTGGSYDEMQYLWVCSSRVEDLFPFFVNKFTINRKSGEINPAN